VVSLAESLPGGMVISKGGKVNSLEVHEQVGACPSKFEVLSIPSCLEMVFLFQNSASSVHEMVEQVEPSFVQSPSFCQQSMELRLA